MYLQLATKWHPNSRLIITSSSSFFVLQPIVTVVIKWQVANPEPKSPGLPELSPDAPGRAFKPRQHSVLFHPAIYGDDRPKTFRFVSNRTKNLPNIQKHENKVERRIAGLNRLPAAPLVHALQYSISCSIMLKQNMWYIRLVRVMRLL